MIRLVTFDLDNTLWSVDTVIRRAEANMNAWLLQRAPEYGQLDSVELAAIHSAVVDANPDVVHDISRRRELVLQAAVERCGYSASVAAELAAGAFAEFLDWRHRIEFFPAALDVLEQLAGRYVLAALTNGNANFERLGLGRFFSFGYCAADVGASKPHPAMFERAIAHAEVAPEQAVHVGDHPVDDVQGATGAGMASVWVNLERIDDDPGATATVDSLAKVPLAIASLAAARDSSPPSP